MGSTAWLAGSTTADWPVTVTVDGNGANGGSFSGPGAFYVPVSLDAIPIGTSTYTIAATASASGCPTITATAGASITRSSQTAVASDSTGFIAIPTGGTFLIGTATISGYDVYERFTATPAGWNLPTLWGNTAVARVSVTPEYRQTEIGDISAWHDIGGVWGTTFTPMQGSFMPADDSWHKTLEASQQQWLGVAPINSTSGIDWMRTIDQQVAVSPTPAAIATATLQ